MCADEIAQTPREQLCYMLGQLTMIEEDKVDVSWMIDKIIRTIKLIDKENIKIADDKK